MAHDDQTPTDLEAAKMMGRPSDFSHLMPTPPTEEEIAASLAEFQRRQIALAAAGFGAVRDGLCLALGPVVEAFTDLAHDLSAALGTRAPKRKRPRRIQKRIKARGGFQRYNSLGAFLALADLPRGVR